jgi:hypothetical protein
MDRLQHLQRTLDSGDIPWLALSLGLTGLVFAFETLVDLRQLPRLSHKSPETLPALQPLLRILGAGKDAANGGDQANSLQESQAYAKEKLRFSLVASVINLVETLLVMAPVWNGRTGLASLWDAAGRVDPHGVPHGRSLLFIVYMSAISSLTAIPVRPDPVERVCL